jgi:hypothetical protein
VTSAPTAAERRDFPDIDDAARRSESDAELFAELREVLERHGAASRFGVTLLHKHFSIDADEVLVETCDVETRTLVTKPYPRALALARPTIDTNWRFDVRGEVAQECWQWCFFDNDAQAHLKEHRPARSGAS